jgi:NAD(P)-dependent dehydrogenase (short-subunit alcohol dehydrogenase family)
MIDINLTGSFIVMQAALPYLRQAEGNVTVVNVCSGIALRPSAGQGGYAASKAGLLALTRVLAQEVGPSIRVNAVCPGATDTPFASGSDHAQLGRLYVLGRVSRPEEQAQVILFLTGAESSFMTGAALSVDGGRTFH